VILLPLLTLLSFILVLINLAPSDDGQKNILRAGILWGAYAIGILEILSLFHAISPLNLTISWLIPLFGSIVWLIVRYHKGNRVKTNRTFPRDGFMRVMLLGVVIILLLTAYVAWKTPPQTWDSLNYHMSRVAHWAQQQAVRHFATGIEVQNNMPPGAEFLVLHTYVLSQGDRWVNFVQWFAMLGSLIAVSLIAKQLGAGQKGQLFAVVFAATIPMGIIQASSTMTDYVLTFWILCVASEAIRMNRDGGEKNAIIYISIAAGLAILSKPTSYSFLLPFALWTLWSLFQHFKWNRVIPFCVVAILIVCLIVGGHFLRNQQLYGNPIGPTDRFDQHANQLFNLQSLISNLVRNVCLHIRTPSPYINKAFAIAIRELHQWMGLDVNDPRTTAWGTFKITTPSTHEIQAGNPLHALLILATFMILLWKRRQFPSSLLHYTFIVLATYVLFSFLYKWLIFGSRLQLPFFLLYAPIVGFLLGGWKKERLANWANVFLLLASIPWLISIETRPILPIPERSPVGSVLTESRLNLLFANGSYLTEPARDVVIRIEASGCTRVGLMLTGNGAEYPFWFMLGSPRKDLRIEWIVADTYSANLSDPTFEPCAVICEDCQIQSENFRGLPVVFERSPYRLYLDAQN